MMTGVTSMDVAGGVFQYGTKKQRSLIGSLPVGGRNQGQFRAGLKPILTLYLGNFYTVRWRKRAGVPAYADVAQLAEQLFCKQQVAGSSPIVGSGVIKRFANLAARAVARVDNWAWL
jgi:hypothetical protein